MKTFALCCLIFPAIIASAPGLGAIAEQDDTQPLLSPEEAAMLVPVYHDVRLHLAIDGSWITVRDRAFIKACVGSLEVAPQPTEEQPSWLFYKHYERSEDEDGDEMEELALVISDRRLTKSYFRFLSSEYWRLPLYKMKAVSIAPSPLLQKFTADLVAKRLYEIPDRERTRTLPRPVRDGEIVLIRRPSAVIALILKEQKDWPKEGLKYSWHLYSGRNPDFTKPPDESGKGEKYGSFFANIELKGINIEWNSCSDGSGYLEYTNRRSVEIALTGKSKLADINLERDRFVFASSVFDYLRHFGMDKWLGRLCDAEEAKSGKADPTIERLKREAGESPLACALLATKWMDQDYGRASGMAAAADWYWQSGERPRAAQILSEALEAARIEADREDTFLTVTALIRVAEGYAKIEQKGTAAKVAAEALEEARALHERMFKDGAIVYVCRSFAAAGEFEQALELARSLENVDDKSSALADIAREYAEDGAKEEFRTLAQEVVRLTENIDHAYSRSSTLATLARGYLSLGDLNEALRVTEMMNEPPVRAPILVDIAARQAKAGQRERALQSLSQAAAAARAIPDPSRKTFELTRVAGGYLELEEKGGVSELVSEVAKLAETLTKPKEKAGALAAAAPWYYELGQKEKCSKLLSRALDVARGVEEIFDRGSALAQVVAAFASARQYDRALQVAEMIDDDSNWQFAIMALCSCYMAHGRYLEALRAIRSIEDVDWKAYLLHDLASGYVEQPWKISEAEKQVLREIVRDMEVQRWWAPGCERSFSRTIATESTVLDQP